MVASDDGSTSGGSDVDIQLLEAAKAGDLELIKVAGDVLSLRPKSAF
jgi:hypothetical protein